MSKKVSWRRVSSVAREHFSISSLRPGQREVIEAVLAKKDVIAVLPTGAGKSLCFQLPALFFKKLTVVVSPLIALMQDQSNKLQSIGIDVAKFNSACPKTQILEALQAIEAGKTPIVYVTPEGLENEDLREVFKNRGVSLLVLDEAHCLSQWGHDFRPAYLSVRDAVRAFGNPPVLALTATATEEVISDITKQLKLEKPKIINQGIDRPNLTFNVLRTVNDNVKFEKLTQLLSDRRGTAIVYTATVRAANELHAKLLATGINAGRYHGKLRSKEREENLAAFMADEFEVMIATKAFGLGIDKPDVRQVIHYQFPDSLESYYQEAGRAGRDGKKAYATLLYRLEDKRIQSFFLGNKYPSREESYGVYEKLVRLAAETDSPKVAVESLAEATGLGDKRLRVILAQLEGAGVISRRGGLRLRKTFGNREALEVFLVDYEQRSRDDQEKLHQMMKYAQSTGCRAVTFREYFGQPPGKVCAKCDNCREPARVQPVTNLRKPSVDFTILSTRTANG